MYFPFPDCKGFARALIHAKLDIEMALGDLRDLSVPESGSHGEELLRRVWSDRTTGSSFKLTEGRARLDVRIRF